MISNLNRMENESDNSYLYRIGSMKEAGFFHATWIDLAEL